MVVLTISPNFNKCYYRTTLWATNQRGLIRNVITRTRRKTQLITGFQSRKEKKIRRTVKLKILKNRSNPISLAFLAFSNGSTVNSKDYTNTFAFSVVKTFFRVHR